MSSRSPFDYDVSVSAAKQRRSRRRAMSGAVETSTRTCDWPGCEGRGQYRAPVSPDRLNEYRWFCLDHVRRYNASWNFFAEVSDEDFEAWTRTATAWERPTWAFGKGPRGPQGRGGEDAGNAWARWGFSDPFEVLGANATLNPAASEAPRPRRRLSPEERSALGVLGVGPEEERRSAVRAAYRALVKELHPDMNAGENPDPARLTRVLKAWEVIKASPRFHDD